jgi:hypothetical protein
MIVLRIVTWICTCRFPLVRHGVVLLANLRYVLMGVYIGPVILDGRD